MFIETYAVVLLFYILYFSSWLFLLIFVFCYNPEYMIFHFLVEHFINTIYFCIFHLTLTFRSCFRFIRRYPRYIISYTKLIIASHYSPSLYWWSDYYMDFDEGWQRRYPECVKICPRTM